MGSKAKKETKKMSSAERRRRFQSGKFYRIMYEKGVLYFLISFIIPAAIMTFAFSKYGIHPFGNRQILVVDLWHQYYPFFRVVREKLMNGGSFMYSWENGLGTNFLSLISYYAASPLNWISVLFDDDHVRDAMTFILVMKIGFAGAFFSSFLRYTFGRKDFSICVFSPMYALCSYVLGYYWNVMWFDTIALFPLVMLGIVAICREGKWKLFTIALAVSLISNYYIGYFSCIFSIFMFAAASIIECKGVKDWFKKLFIMARSSVLGIMLGGFMLLPAYFGLQLTYSTHNTMPTEVTFYEKWTDIFANLLSYSPPTKVDGLPNFACGMLAVVLFGVFLFSFGIKIREKIAALLMLAVIAVSCNMNILNFIWHGFHFTNQIPYRFAFIFSFVLAVSAFRAYDIMLSRGIKIYQFVLMLLGPVAVVVLNYYSKGKDFTFKGALTSSLVISAAFLLIFVALRVFPFKSKGLRNILLNFALAAAVISESISNAQLGVKTVDTTGYKDYPTRSEEIQGLLTDMRNMDDTPFYRSEVTETYTLNDSALYGYYGLSQFSSSANVSVTTFIKRLGLYASEAGNRYYYRTSTPVVNSLLGIKYLIKKGGYLNTEEMALEHRSVREGSHLYENKYSLSLGFMMNTDILAMEDSPGLNPFEYQNDIIQLATGSSEPVFTPQPVALVTYDGMDVTKNGYGNYTFTNTKENGSAGATYTFDGVAGGYLYGYANSTGACCDVLNIKCDGTTIDSGKLIESYPLLFPMGNAQEGGSSTVEIRCKENIISGNFKLMIYALSQSAFEKAYNELADEQLEISSFSDTKITGTVTAKKDGVLFLSIPYENGWSVYVDGKKAETFQVMQSMLGAEVPEGTHDIRIEYTPEGFTLGVAISACGLLLMILLVIIDRKKRKYAATEAASTDLSAADNEAAFETEMPATVTPGSQPEDIPDSSGSIHDEPQEGEAVFGNAEEAAVVLYSPEQEEENAEPEGDSGVSGD